LARAVEVATAPFFLESNLAPRRLSNADIEVVFLKKLAKASVCAPDEDTQNEKQVRVAAFADKKSWQECHEM
jgi:hypothetical protein